MIAINFFEVDKCVVKINFKASYSMPAIDGSSGTSAFKKYFGPESTSLQKMCFKKRDG